MYRIFDNWRPSGGRKASRSVYRPDSTFCLTDAVAAPLQTLRHVITALVSSIYIDPFFLDAASSNMFSGTIESDVTKQGVIPVAIDRQAIILRMNGVGLLQSTPG